MKASEASLEQVQIFREGDVGDLAESQRNVFDVQKVAVRVCIANRSLGKSTQEPNVDQILASIPPLYLFEEKLDIKRIIAVQLVLINEETVSF